MPTVRMTQITALVLQAIAAGYQYGFDVMDATGLASGTVYPALRRLEEAGLLRGRWERAQRARRDGRPPRRLYELTDSGTKSLDRAAQKLSDVSALIVSLSGSRELSS